MSAKKTELEELRGKPADKLTQELDRLREEMFRLRFGALAESLENTMKIRVARKRVARIKTLLAAASKVPATTLANEG